MPSPDDDYDQYFGELQDEDLALINQTIAQHTSPRPVTPISNALVRGSPRNTVATRKRSSPRTPPPPTSKGPSTPTSSPTVMNKSPRAIRSPELRAVSNRTIGNAIRSRSSSPIKGRSLIPSAQAPLPSQTLLQLFRLNGRLSVTDLVGPTWCEVKFDYSLRGKRFKGEKMDDVIVSKHGKAIPVHKPIVIQSEKAMTGGNMVHKKLEVALPTYEVIMKVSTHEERFALRVLNMITNLHMLKSTGICREFGVMGIVEGVYVTGVIDEVLHKPVDNPIPTGAPTSAGARTLKGAPTSTGARTVTGGSAAGGGSSRTASPIKSEKRDGPKQLKLDSFLPTYPDPLGLVSSPIDLESDSDVVMVTANNTPDASQGSETTSLYFTAPSTQQSMLSEPYQLRISDTKTRGVRSLPKDDLGGRLQLMLYHQMLEAAVSPPYPDHIKPPVSASNPVKDIVIFSYPLIFQHLKLQPNALFSDQFIAEATQILDDFDEAEYELEAEVREIRPPVRCLNDIVDVWYDAVRRLSLVQKLRKVSSFAAVPTGSGPVDVNMELIYRSREHQMRQMDVRDEHWNTTTAASGIAPNLMTRILQDTQAQLPKKHSRLKSGSGGGHRSPSKSTPAIKTLQDGPASPERSVSPIEEFDASAMDIDSLEQAANIIASQGSEEDWERIFGDGYIKEEELLAIEIPVALSPQKSQERRKDSLVPSSSPLRRSPRFSRSTAQPDPAAEAVASGRTTPTPIKAAKAKKGGDTASTAETGSLGAVANWDNLHPKTKNSKTDVIGKTCFFLDKAFLAKHVKASLEFWHSLRDLRGVDLEDTWKCNACEYREGCEWREAKAFEATLRVTNAL